MDLVKEEESNKMDSSKEEEIITESSKEEEIKTESVKEEEKSLKKSLKEEEINMKKSLKKSPRKEDINKRKHLKKEEINKKKPLIEECHFQIAVEKDEIEEKSNLKCHDIEEEKKKEKYHNIKERNFTDFYPLSEDFLAIASFDKKVSLTIIDREWREEENFTGFQAPVKSITKLDNDLIIISTLDKSIKILGKYSFFLTCLNTTTIEKEDMIKKLEIYDRQFIPKEEEPKEEKKQAGDKKKKTTDISKELSKEQVKIDLKVTFKKKKETDDPKAKKEPTYYDFEKVFGFEQKDKYKNKDYFPIHIVNLEFKPKESTQKSAKPRKELFQILFEKEGRGKGEDEIIFYKIPLEDLKKDKFNLEAISLFSEDTHNYSCMHTIDNLESNANKVISLGKTQFAACFEDGKIIIWNVSFKTYEALGAKRIVEKKEVEEFFISDDIDIEKLNTYSLKECRSLNLEIKYNLSVRNGPVTSLLLLTSDDTFFVSGTCNRESTLDFWRTSKTKKPVKTIEKVDCWSNYSIVELVNKEPLSIMVGGRNVIYLVDCEKFEVVNYFFVDDFISCFYATEQYVFCAGKHKLIEYNIEEKKIQTTNENLEKRGITCIVNFNSEILACGPWTPKIFVYECVYDKKKK